MAQEQEPLYCNVCEQRCEPARREPGTGEVVTWVCVNPACPRYNPPLLVLASPN